MRLQLLQRHFVFGSAVFRKLGHISSTSCFSDYYKTIAENKPSTGAVQSVRRSQTLPQTLPQVDGTLASIVSTPHNMFEVEPFTPTLWIVGISIAAVLSAFVVAVVVFLYRWLRRGGRRTKCDADYSLQKKIFNPQREV